MLQRLIHAYECDFFKDIYNLHFRTLLIMNCIKEANTTILTDHFNMAL